LEAELEMEMAMSMLLAVPAEIEATNAFTPMMT
jgi:hypothetical protein